MQHGELIISERGGRAERIGDLPSAWFVLSEVMDSGSPGDQRGSIWASCAI